MTAIPATDTLICPVCDELIEQGEPIIYVDDEAVHEDCEP